MSQTEIKTTGDGQFAVEGELSKFTVPGITQKANGMIQAASQDILIDLANVTHTDSAGLALLLEWMSIASRKKQAIHFRNLPDQLWKIAEVSDLENILPLAD